VYINQHNITHHHFITINTTTLLSSLPYYHHSTILAMVMPTQKLSNGSAFTVIADSNDLRHVASQSSEDHQQVIPTVPYEPDHHQVAALIEDQQRDFEQQEVSQQEARQQDIDPEAHHQEPQQQEVPIEAQQQELEQQDIPPQFQPVPALHIVNGVH
jgi:hypothetical protein